MTCLSAVSLSVCSPWSSNSLRPLSDSWEVGRWVGGGKWQRSECLPPGHSGWLHAMTPEHSSGQVVSPITLPLWCLRSHSLVQENSISKPLTGSFAGKGIILFPQSPATNPTSTFSKLTATCPQRQKLHAEAEENIPEHRRELLIRTRFEISLQFPESWLWWFAWKWPP